MNSKIETKPTNNSTISALSFSESKPVVKHIFEVIAKAKVEFQPIGEIQDDSQYRLDDRTHMKGAEKTLEVKDLAEQLDELAMLNPILIIQHGSSFQIASGRKRWRAAEEAGLTEVPVKCISFETLFPGESALWDSQKKEALLKEALNNVVYSESEHNSKLTDKSILSFLRQIKENYGYVKNEFELVMRRLGLKRDKSEYRNIKRLWGVVTDDTLFNLVQENSLRLSDAKSEKTQETFALPEKVIKIREYLETCRQNEKEENGESAKALTESEKYADIVAFIRNTGNASSDDNADDYRVPNFRVDARGTFLKVPAISLNLADRNRSNVAKIVEHYYVLLQVTAQLEEMLKGLKPNQVGERIQPVGISPTISPIEYGDRYLEFVRSWNMQHYCNIKEVEECAFR